MSSAIASAVALTGAPNTLEEPPSEHVHEAMDQSSSALLDPPWRTSIASNYSYAKKQYFTATYSRSSWACLCETHLCKSRWAQPPFFIAASRRDHPLGRTKSNRIIY